VTGGAGAMQFNAGTGTTLTGGAGGVSAFNLGTGNSIVGSTAAATFMDDSYTNPADATKFTGGTNTLVGGAAASRIIAGPSDSVVAGAGGLEAEIRSNLAGSVTVAAGAGADGIRDANVGAGTTKVTVTGFATASDKIESAQSGAALVTASSKDGGGNVILNFIDGTTMTLIGVTDPTKITFTA